MEIGIYKDDYKKPDDFHLEDQSKMSFSQRVDYNIRYIEIKLKRELTADEILETKKIVQLEYEEDTGQKVKCLLCDDLGYICPVGQEKTNIKYKKCSCIKNNITNYEKALFQWHEDADFKPYTFETMDSKNSKDVQAKTSIYKFAQKQNKRLLVLHGPPGTGKSHGLKAIVNYKAKKGETGIYMMYSKYSVIVSNFQKENHKDISLIEQMMKTKYLIIDDVEPVYENNPIPKQKFEQILIVRFDHNLTTAINTNLDLNSFSSPVVSRFLDEKNTLLINYSMVKDKRS